MPNKDNIDAFWDIEDLIPQRPKKNIVKPAHTDIFAEEIVFISEKEQGGEVIPARKESLIKQPEKQKSLREYSPKQSLIQNVRILPWPTLFEFYTKFRKDAIRYFELTHEPCEYVYFFSYMPQYEQMTVSQMSYYLYWRSEARKGNFLKTDINYLFLYVYEIINLPEKIPAREGALILSRLWKTYRAEFHYLDKYFGEWLCDYCLIHAVSPDWDVLEDFVGDVAGKVSLPEFYMRDGLLSWGLISAVSSYDYKKSKYYEQYAEAYDLHIPKAVEKAVNSVIIKNPNAFGITVIKTVRDSYAGAVASHKAKCKIELSRYAIRKSAARGEHELKQIFAGLIKLAENRIRMYFGIKSRFSPIGLDAQMKEEILSYFNAVYPEQSRKKQPKNDEEEAYMALYEPKQTGKADISRALAIEEQAWETAELLSTEEDDEIAFEPFPEETVSPLDFPENKPIEEKAETKNPLSTGISFSFENMSDTDGDFSFIQREFSAEQREALRAALENRFAQYCRSVGKMADHVRGELNEIAMEAIDDMILEEDFSPVADYLDEMKEFLYE